MSVVLAVAERCSPPGVIVFYCTLQWEVRADLDLVREFDVNFVKTNPKFLRGGSVPAGLDYRRQQYGRRSIKTSLWRKKSPPLAGLLAELYVTYALRYVAVQKREKKLFVPNPQHAVYRTMFCRLFAMGHTGVTNLWSGITFLRIAIPLYQCDGA